MSANTHLFESGLTTSLVTPQLDSLIREHLELAARDVLMGSSDAPPSPPSEPPATSGAGLVNEVGDYLIRTARLLSQLSDKLMKGPHIDRATLEVHEQSRLDSYCSDLSAVAAMDVSLGRLRAIRDLTAKYSQEIEGIWRPEPYEVMGSPPIVHDAGSQYFDVPSSDPRSVSGLDDADPRGQKMRRMIVDSALEQRTGGDVSGSDQSDDDDDEEQFALIDMEALKQRGKGTYYCPKGLRCDKGGVDKDGNLVLFDRNSSFALAASGDRDCQRTGDACAIHPKAP